MAPYFKYYLTIAIVSVAATSASPVSTSQKVLRVDESNPSPSASTEAVTAPASSSSVSVDAAGGVEIDIDMGHRPWHETEA